MKSAMLAETATKPVRIVLVEDNTADVYLLEKALRARNLNYELTRFEDGQGALNALGAVASSLPDLILLDLNLPRRDGFEVLTTIRGNPALVSIPVGILTSSDTEKDRHRIQLLGVERFIHKPPTLDEFVETVGRAIDELLGRHASD